MQVIKYLVRAGLQYEHPPGNQGRVIVMIMPQGQSTSDAEQ
jgi:hypothetical protein